MSTARETPHLKSFTIGLDWSQVEQKDKQNQNEGFWFVSNKLRESFNPSEINTNNYYGLCLTNHTDFNPTRKINNQVALRTRKRKNEIKTFPISGEKT